jgi:hypothetical protein
MGSVIDLTPNMTWTFSSLVPVVTSAAPARESSTPGLPASPSRHLTIVRVHPATKGFRFATGQSMRHWSEIYSPWSVGLCSSRTRLYF